MNVRAATALSWCTICFAYVIETEISISIRIWWVDVFNLYVFRSIKMPSSWLNNFWHATIKYGSEFQKRGKKTHTQKHREKAVYDHTSLAWLVGWLVRMYTHIFVWIGKGARWTQIIFQTIFVNDFFFAYSLEKKKLHVRSKKEKSMWMIADSFLCFSHRSISYIIYFFFFANEELQRKKVSNFPFRPAFMCTRISFLLKSDFIDKNKCTRTA